MINNVVIRTERPNCICMYGSLPPSHVIQPCTPHISPPTPATGAEDHSFAVRSWEEVDLWTWRYEKQFPKQVAGIAPRAQISENGVVREENERVEFCKDRKRIREDLKRVLMSKPGLHRLVVSYLLSVWATLIAKIESKHLETCMEIWHCCDTQRLVEPRAGQAMR